MPFRYGHIIEEEVRQHRSDDVRSQQVHIKHDCVVLLKEERRDHVHGEQAHDVATEIENDVGRPLNRTQLVFVEEKHLDEANHRSAHTHHSQELLLAVMEESRRLPSHPTSLALPGKCC